jgi:hypothetical protein
MEAPYILPGSIYWIGDVRHVMPDDIFYNAWKHNNYEEGVYDVNNYKFIVVPAICGDDYSEDFIDDNSEDFSDEEKKI